MSFFSLTRKKEGKIEQRTFVKFLRAKFKTQYLKLKKEGCYICGSNKGLEVHHVKPLSVIADEYLEKHKLMPENTEELRDRIFEECKTEICSDENCITLCKKHHKALHSLFGNTYSVKMVNKVRNYINNKRRKFYEVH